MTIDEHDFQGGIIKGHGRRHSAYIFLTFKPSESWGRMRKWLSGIAKYVTTVAAQKCQYYIRENDPDTTHLNVALNTFDFLPPTGESGFPELDLHDRHDTVATLGQYPDGADVHSAYAPEINSNSKILLIVANNDFRKLKRKVDELIYEFERGNTVGVSKLFVIREDGDGPHLGPLGFVDGVGNPSPEEAPGLVLNEHGAIGQYSTLALINFLARGNVFDDKVLEIARCVDDVYDTRCDEEQFELKKEIAARLMGRFKDGRDLGGGYRKDLSDLFAGDPGFVKCPVGAHVRAVHSTGESRIVRRGTPYVIQHNGEEKKGLMFVSFQKDLRAQLFPMMKSMEDKLDLITYFDVAKTKGPDQVELNLKVGGLDRKVEVDFKDFQPVEYLGGNYFLVPGKNYLLSLADEDKVNNPV